MIEADRIHKGTRVCMWATCPGTIHYSTTTAEWSPQTLDGEPSALNCTTSLEPPLLLYQLQACVPTVRASFKHVSRRINLFPTRCHTTTLHAPDISIHTY